MPDSTLPHPEGSVAWLDTLLTGQQEYLRFYQPLFGWSGEPDPSDEVARYAQQRVHGKAVAGIGYMSEEHPMMPWTGYFSVRDAEATVARIPELGGTVICEAMNAGNNGRFAHGVDPGGAHFGLWQALDFPGFEVYGEPGCLAWFELVTTEGKASADFYGALFGAEVQAMAEMADSYWTLHIGGEPRAGIFRVDEVETPHWRPYFQVADVDIAVAAALAAGAHVTEPVADTPFGRMAGLTDPNGIEIKVMTPPW
ncbi:MAG TPA: VOC family protein [Actinospica sp.]|jgi:predicted enzyme related to lactoylglutathione lyase|nr:VOC family protein [Actinospica sp.]